MTTTGLLNGLKILVVEDEVLVAMDLAHMIRRLGGDVLGPVGTVRGATEVMEQTEIDGAVMDLGLGRESGSGVAERLLANGVPILLTTGYGDQALPDALAHVPRLSKPYSMTDFQRLAAEHFLRS